MKTEYLKCELTDDELRENGIILARANGKIIELEAQKKKFNDQIKADISSAEAEISRLSTILQNGYEFRQVEVEEKQDFEEKKIFVIRLDTGEEIRSRNMGPEDLQENMFDE